MHNFFVNDNQFKDNTAYINGIDYNHIKNVLRMKPGDKFYITNKDLGITYLSQLNSIRQNEIECVILDKVESRESNLKITLYQGIPKSDKMDMIIQKTTELGIYSIVPTEMKYCVAKLNNEDKKIKRWQLIAEAAAKQSKRNIIPIIQNKINFSELEQEVKKYDLAILAYENETHTNLKQLLQQNKNVKSIAIIIGPEGGLSADEVSKLGKCNVQSASLGKRILRTETASIAMLSMIMYEYEF